MAGYWEEIIRGFPQRLTLGLLICYLLRPVSNSDGVGVGFVIRSVRLNVLLKTAL